MGIHPLFDTLTPEQLAEARPWLQFQGAEAGTPILAEGEEDPFAIAVISGTLEVSRGGFLLDRYGAGEVFGSELLFGDEASEVAVLAAEPCRLVILDRVALDALRDLGSPLSTDLERAAIREVATALQEVNCQVGRLTGDESFMEERTPPPAVLGAILDRVLTRETAEPAPPGTEPPECEILAASGMFADATTAELAGIAARMQRRSFARGSFLSTQGERGDAMVFLASGSMEVAVADEEHHRIHALGTMGPGSVLGIASLLADCTSRASCVASGRVEALVLDRWAFESLVRARNPAGSVFRRGLLALVTRQLGDARRAMRAHRKRPRRVELLRAGAGVDVTGESPRLAS